MAFLMDKEELLTLGRWFIAGLIACGFLIWLSTMIGCQMKVDENIIVYGSCEDMMKIEKNSIYNIYDTDNTLKKLTDYRNDIPISVYTHNRTLDSFATTTSTTYPLTTTTIAVCEPTPCVCEICTKCPTCSYELSPEQIHWFLNDCRPKNSESACKQAGEAEACQRVMEYLQIPGRPKFKLTPSVGVGDYYRSSRKTDTDLYCFKNLGGYFILNRTAYYQGEGNVSRSKWGWNDDDCKTSSLRINDL
jgi:hypothetical protein